jgi:fatty-acyl-CoA synthase
LNILPTPAFSLGAAVVLHERFDADAACAALETVSHAIVVPTVLQAIMACPAWDRLDLTGLQAMSIGSTDVPIDLIEVVQNRGVPVCQVYGATETAPFAIYQRWQEAVVTTGSIGRAGCACDIRLVRDGQDVTDGTPGEIWVRGDNVLLGYWNEPELSATALIDGWFRTGDVATRDADGLYWFTDRIKHVIISGGENIYPAEIERVLRTHPQIEEVAVVGRADPRWGEVPVAVVVGALTAEDVMGALDGQIARYKRPQGVVFVDALPRNAMGKVVAEDVRALLDSVPPLT